MKNQLKTKSISVVFLNDQIVHIQASLIFSKKVKVASTLGHPIMKIFATILRRKGRSSRYEMWMCHETIQTSNDAYGNWMIKDYMSKRKFKIVKTKFKQHPVCPTQKQGLSRQDVSRPGIYPKELVPLRNRVWSGM